MKKLAITIILALAMIYSTGQVVESIGIKGGVSYANQTWEYTTPDFTVKKDIIAGSAIILTADFFKSRHLCLTTDLGLIQKGFEEDIPVTSEEFPEIVSYYETYKSTINYLTFSPKLSVNYNIHNLSAYCFIGPRVDVQTGFRTYLSVYNFSLFNKTIWGMTYGGGVEYRIKSIGILLEMAGYPDFTPIQKVEPSATSAGLKITGQSYSLFTGIKYYLSED